jgi:O-antigen/teichoic acid export membrane protein
MELRQSSNQALDRLTKAMGFDVRFYGKSFIWLGFGQTSGVIRGIATTFLMARWLPRNIMGEFRYVLAMFAIAGMFAAGGVSAGIIRGVAKGDTVVVWAGIKRILMIAPLGSLVLLLAAIERWYVGEPTVAAALAFSGIVFPAYAICGLYGSILTGQERIQRLTKIAIINNTLFAVCFFLVIWKTKELLPVFFAYLGIDILFRGFLTWNEVRKLPKTGSVEEHIKLGDHLNAIGILQALAAQLDQILLHRLAGYGTLANYSIAMLIPEQIKDFVNAIGGVMLRRFSKREQTAKTLIQTRRHFWTMLGLTALIVVAYAFVAPIAIPWLFPQYGSEVLPSIVYAIGLLGLVTLVGLNYFQAHHNIKALWRFYGLNTAIQVAGNVVLIPLFGAWGAILSKTTTRLASIGLSYPTSNQKTAQDNDKTPLANNGGT